MKYIDKDGNVADICIKGIGDITHEYPQLNTTAKELIGAINENTASLAENATLVKENTQESIIEAVNKLDKKTNIIKLKDGVYLLDDLIFENLNNIIFEGTFNTILKNLSPRKSIITFRKCNNITFRNITFDGGYTTLMPEEYGSIGVKYEYESCNLTVDNCIFMNINDCAINDKTQSSVSNELELTNDTKVSKSLIINNRFFNCKHSYLAKSGGSKAVIYTNNTHYKCSTGVKVDGETYLNDYSWTSFPTKTGEYIISNNIFIDGVGYNSGAFVNVEEYSENVIISNNVFKNIKDTDCITISQGQSDKTVKNITINGNIFDEITNGFGVSIRNESSKGTIFNNLHLLNNTFSNLIKGSIFVKGYGSGEINNLIIKNNIFDEKKGSIGGYTINIEFNGLATLKNSEITSNKFIGDTNSFSSNVNDGFIRFNKISLDNKLSMIIKDNDFCIDGAVLQQFMIMETNCCLLNNNIKGCIISSTASKIDYIDNFLESAYIMLNKSSIQTSDSKFNRNVFSKGINPQNYAIRVGDTGTHVGKYNEFIGYSKAVYQADGAYKEDNGTTVCSSSGKHYRISVDENGVLSTIAISI